MYEAIEINSQLKSVFETLQGLKATMPLTRQKELIGLERLHKLADHGINGELVQDEFNLDHFHQKAYLNLTGLMEKPYCHTSGCMIGECPGIFKEWIWDQHNIPRLITLDRNEFVLTVQSGMEFFDISELEFGHLFYPGDQDSNFTNYQCFRLTGRSTKEEVGENMLDFIQFRIARIKQETT